jgi:serine/threonine protein kinase
MVDFGFAKHIPFMKGKVEQLQSFTLCGTPEYLSPELVLSKGHDKSVDYWALGCLIFELLVGQTPFADQHQSEIFKKIIHSERSIHFPVGFDANARDLVQRLLMKNPAQRLGNLAGGVGDIQNHPWFVAAGFDWSALESRTVSPPYSPPIADALDTANFDQYQEDDNVEPYYGSQAPFEAF